MSGHNKWSKIKRQKEGTDAQKSKVFGKLSRLLSIESKKVNGDKNSAALQAAIKLARDENMPSDNIDRAIKKGASNEQENLDAITYESYGPGGTALIIEALTSNRNKAAQEVKHILSNNGFALAGMGAATWAFEKENSEWKPKTMMPISEEDAASLEKLIEELEESEEVQAVYTNAE
jgi:YebC/PmpR family DNA-binding regulatory protein